MHTGNRLDRCKSFCKNIFFFSSFLVFSSFRSQKGTQMVSVESILDRTGGCICNQTLSALSVHHSVLCVCVCATFYSCSCKIDIKGQQNKFQVSNSDFFRS